MPSGRRKTHSPESQDYNGTDSYDNNDQFDDGRDIDDIKTETRRNETNGNYSEEESPYNEKEETSPDTAYRHSNDSPDATNGNHGGSNDESRRLNGDDNNKNDMDNKANKKERGRIYSSSIISGLMDQYLSFDYNSGEAPPVHLKPRSQSEGNNNNVDELENNLKNLDVSKKKRQPPPVRHKPPPGHKTWNDPRDQQRPKIKEKHWPPREEPKDIGAYVAESYGQTDPYSNRLIKDIQKSKREEEEKKAAEKRSEIVHENIQPVSTLRSTFAHKPPKPRPGMLRPEANLVEERAWIKHEKKNMVFDTPPDEPDWMRLIRNRRWNSTVKARFPCKATDKTDFERRSTTPKNWKRLAQDKNALKMLSEVVGIGAEGEELFMRLASQRQKMEEEQEKIDRMAEEELMAYEVARESLGEDAAYSLQMDNPLPAARMLHLGPTASIVEGGSEHGSDGSDTPSGSNVSYPFTTSQLEAAYLTNQLLRLHPEEFKKLMSLERSRQATLRWQFSSDPFDSVHEHQSLPYEIAMLASQEPRVQQAMRRILAQSDTDDYYGSVFGNSKPRSRMARSEGYASRYESDQEGYESSSSVGIARGRPRTKKAPVPPPKNVRGRSVSPAMMGRKAHESNGLNLKIPKDDNREVQSHGLFSDEDLEGLNDEVAQIDQLTSNLARNIDDELASIESSLEDRKRGFFEETLRNENVQQAKDVDQVIDREEMSSRRKDFAEKARRSSFQADPADDIPKQRHKVRRINSNAELNAVFRKRRQASECQDDSENAQGAPQPQQNTQLSQQQKGEMNDLMQSISDTYGDQL